MGEIKKSNRRSATALKILLAIGIISFNFSCDPLKKTDFENPEKIWGDLYEEVIKEKIVNTPKEFWDCTPIADPKAILKAYHNRKKSNSFSLQEFLGEFFTIPEYSDPYQKSNLEFEEYVRQEFDHLILSPKENRSSFIATRMKYVSGTGMYNEANYFSSFFDIKALLTLRNDSLASDLATNNFQFIQNYGYVPYGNRIYYLGFPGVPVLSLMTESVAQYKPEFLKWSASLLSQDYQYWMSLSVNDKTGYKDALKNNAKAFRSTVFMEKDRNLNRYFSTSENHKYLSLNQAAGAENTSRFTDKNITSFVALDLNALLFHYEKTMAAAYWAIDKKEYSESYTNLSKIRKELIDKYLYNPEKAFYYDYDFNLGKQSQAETLAALYPLLVGLSDKQQIQGVVNKIKNDFLVSNGLKTDISKNSGSAEYNYLAVLALRNVGETELAETIKNRWLSLNKEYFSKHGFILPEYNLDNPDESPKIEKRMDSALAVLIALINE